MSILVRDSGTCGTIACETKVALTAQAPRNTAHVPRKYRFALVFGVLVGQIIGPYSRLPVELRWFHREAQWPQNFVHDGARAITSAQVRRPTPSCLDVLPQVLACVVPLLGCRGTYVQLPDGGTTVAPVAHPRFSSTASQPPLAST